MPLFVRIAGLSFIYCVCGLFVYHNVGLLGIQEVVDHVGLLGIQVVVVILM